MKLSKKFFPTNEWHGKIAHYFPMAPREESTHRTLRQAESFKLPPGQSKDQCTWKLDYRACGLWKSLL